MQKTLTYIFIFLVGAIPLIGQEALLTQLTAPPIRPSHPLENNLQSITESLWYNWNPEVLNQDLISIDLFGQHYKFEQLHYQKHLTKSTSWVGRPINDPYGYVILTLTGKQLVGQIWLSNHRHFLLFGSTEDQLIKLVEYLPESLECNHSTKSDESFYTAQTAIDDLCEDTLWCESSVVDVMMVYTEMAANEMGNNEDEVHSGLVTALVQSNMIGLNSEANFSYRLIHAEQIDFIETGYTVEEVLDSLHYGEGNINEVGYVSELKKQVKADLVAIVTGIEALGGGIAYPNSFSSSYFSSQSYSVNPAFALFNGSQVLTHEMGHNLGLRHDYQSDSMFNAGFISGSLPCPAMRGYINKAGLTAEDPDRSWRTIMAYGSYCALGFNGADCPVVPFYSNPELTFGFGEIKDPMGMDGTDEKSTNAVKFINRGACWVADFNDSLEDADWILDPTTVDYWVTGIEELSLQNSIELYQDKNELLITFEKEQSYEIELLDANGRMIQKLNSQTLQTSLTIQNMSQGIYFVKVSNKTEQMVKKIAIGF